ncbi:hypothetical protein BGZ81_010183, partial [Podila clonocystis]
MAAPDILSQCAADSALETLPERAMYRFTALPKLHLTPEEYEYTSKHKVLISGGGLGGLTLALLLQKVNIPLLVFEGTNEVKPF